MGKRCRTNLKRSNVMLHDRPYEVQLEVIKWIRSLVTSWIGDAVGSAVDSAELINQCGGACVDGNQESSPEGPEEAVVELRGEVSGSPCGKRPRRDEDSMTSSVEAAFRVGDVVECFYEADSKWYPARIDWIDRIDSAQVMSGAEAPHQLQDHVNDGGDGGDELTPSAACVGVTFLGYGNEQVVPPGWLKLISSEHLKRWGLDDTWSVARDPGESTHDLYLGPEDSKKDDNGSNKQIGQRENKHISVAGTDCELGATTGVRLSDPSRGQEIDCADTERVLVMDLPEVAMEPDGKQVSSKRGKRKGRGKGKGRKGAGEGQGQRGEDNRMVRWISSRSRSPYPGVQSKYWGQRYRFFSLYDRGVRLDPEGWFSVTPECISKHIAERCRCDVAVDPFVGCGGNAIQLAMTCHLVIAIDIDPIKLHHARHNASIYGVEDRIEFILGDAMSVLPTVKADVVFLSPPWGGPAYSESPFFDLDTMIPAPLSARGVFKAAQGVTPNVAFFLPRNVDAKQVATISCDPNPSHSSEVERRGLLGEEQCELEHQFLNGKLKTTTAYFGELFRAASAGGQGGCARAGSGLGSSDEGEWEEDEGGGDGSGQGYGEGRGSSCGAIDEARKKEGPGSAVPNPSVIPGRSDSLKPKTAWASSEWCGSRIHFDNDGECYNERRERGGEGVIMSSSQCAPGSQHDELGRGRPSSSPSPVSTSLVKRDRGDSPLKQGQGQTDRYDDDRGRGWVVQAVRRENALYATWIDCCMHQLES